jgi:hypothetical protein
MNERTATGKYHRHDAAQTGRYLIAVRGELAVVGSRSGLRPLLAFPFHVPRV